MACFDKAIEIRPDYAEAYSLRLFLSMSELNQEIVQVIRSALQCGDYKAEFDFHAGQNTLKST